MAANNRAFKRAISPSLASSCSSKVKSCSHFSRQKRLDFCFSLSSETCSACICSSFCAVVARSWSAVSRADCRLSFNCSISLDLPSLSGSRSTCRASRSALRESDPEPVLSFARLTTVLLHSIVLITPVSFTKILMHHHLYLGRSLEHPAVHNPIHSVSLVSSALPPQSNSL